MAHMTILCLRSVQLYTFSKVSSEASHNDSEMRDKDATTVLTGFAMYRHPDTVQSI